MQNEFYVKYLRRRPFPIDAHFDAQFRPRRLATVAHLISAFKSDVAPLLDAVSIIDLVLKSTSGTIYNSGDALAVLGENGRTGTNPLIIEMNDAMDIEELPGIPNPTKDEFNILTHGLPPLGQRHLYSSAKSTTRAESVYGIKVEVETAPFGILRELKLEHLTKAPSLLWIEAARRNPMTLKNWSGEVNIQTYVENALTDCLELSSLLETLDIYREQTFSVIMGKQGNRVDVATLVKGTFFITGVAEVKLPGSNLSSIYQAVDYMIDLRNSFNVRFVFGVLTTYEEWKIFWFEDTNEAALCNSRAEYDELCLGGSATEYAITEGKVKVFQSETYRHDDPGLIEILATLLYKVSKTPVYNPTKFIDEHSRYVYAGESIIMYKQLPKELQVFKYAMPPRQTRNFYILSYFHRGGDGRVALVASAAGNLAVIKFLHQNDDPDALQSALLLEQARWLELWQVQCRLVCLRGRTGLLMPFCMPFDEHRPGVFPFSSLQSWTKRSLKVDDDMLSDELETCVNMEQLKKYQESPLLAAEEAVAALSNKFCAHGDLCFRHVALLPKWNKEKRMYDLCPIFIDLSRVDSELTPQVAQSRALQDLNKLTHELDILIKAK